MNLAYWNTPRAPRSPALNKPAAGFCQVPQKCSGASSRDRDCSGADTACGARATLFPTQWRLPTGLSEREMFESDGGILKPYYGEAAP